jgi:hypothetical protein
MRLLARTLLISAALGACVLAIAACGSSSSSSGRSTTTAGGAAGGGQAGQTALAKFQSCLKSQGVTTPFGGGRRRPGGQPGTGTNAQPPTGTNAQPPAGTQRPGRQIDAKTRKAMQTCAKYRPQGAGGFGGGGGGYGPPAQQGTATSGSPS